MNLDIRNMLVEAAHSSRKKPLFYGDIAKVVGIDLDSEKGRGEIGQLLGKIAVHEANAGRPILTAVVINSPSSREQNRKKHGGDGYHGEGFYRIAEKLGKGKKGKLRRDYFGMKELTRCFELWGKDDYYQRNKEDRAVVSSSIPQPPPFFTVEELEALNAVAGQPYEKENEEHQRIKRLHIDSIHIKIEYWADRLLEVLPGFKATVENRWLKGQSTFQRYSWGRIYREEHSKNGIFFTLAAATVPAALEFKLDCKSEGTSKQLTEEQARPVKDSIPTDARSVRVPLETVHTYGWDRLIQESRDFIINHQNAYDWLHDLVAEISEEGAYEQAPAPIPLFKTDPPAGIKEFPEIERTFKGRDPDYEAIGRERTQLGAAGEELVRKLEKDKLRGTPHADNKIEKQADGVGYDLKSWTKKGTELHIEVKTTKGGIDTPFYLSANERAYAELVENKYRYVIYRVYDYSIRHNKGKYFIIRNVAKSIIKKPTVYKCRYKGPG